MRLINVETKALEEFLDDSAPAYAILSHTWGADHDEVLFTDVDSHDITKIRRSRKFSGCCAQAAADGYAYVWVDTCCIDKNSSTELSEAINSMFRWYRNASVCYAYLSDVSTSDGPLELSSSFGQSRWFRRGWTLQELIAPRTLRFYDKEWTCLGTKRELAHLIVDITGIPRPFLLGMAELRDSSVAQRMSWAAKRTTKRKEDMAYCLLGIFDISMPMIYGEGDRAFLRLQEYIMRHIQDDSILAWGFRSANTTLAGALATSPSEFANCGRIVSNIGDYGSFDPIQIVGGRLHFRRPFHIVRGGERFVVLMCRLSGHPAQPLGMPIRKGLSVGMVDGHERAQGITVEMLEPNALVGELEDIWLSIDPRESDHVSEQWQGLHIDNTLERSLRVVEVNPAVWWHRETDMIVPHDQRNGNNPGRACLRFRQIGTITNTLDFLLILDFAYRDDRISTPTAISPTADSTRKSINGSSPPRIVIPMIAAHVMVCPRDTDMHELLVCLDRIDPGALGKDSASNGPINLRMDLWTERVGIRETSVPRLNRISSTPAVTIDAARELRSMRQEAELLTVFQQDHELFLTQEELGKRLKSKITNLNTDKDELAKVEKMIQTMEEQRNSLRARIGSDNTMLQQLNKERLNLRAKRAELSTTAENLRSDLGISYQSRLAKKLVEKWHLLFANSHTDSTLWAENHHQLTDEGVKRLMKTSANSITLLALRHIRRGQSLNPFDQLDNTGVSSGSLTNLSIGTPEASEKRSNENLRSPGPDHDETASSTSSRRPAVDNVAKSVTRLRKLFTK
ncbi:hypothetical protein G7054_g11197 [Neopestalotiopsis clavispora]|nr:hypothetical protein G7054_g11197 [Neopestalotiopsis clavispora]